MSTALVPSNGSSIEKIVEGIIELIRQRELQVGDQLPPIRELSKLFGYKATAVRDALIQAQAMGVVRVLPRAGAFVQKTSLPMQPGSPDWEQADDFVARLDGHEHNFFHLLDARRVIELELGLRALKRRQMEDLLPLRQTLEAMTGIPVSQRRTNYVDLDIQFHLQLARLGGNPVLALMLQNIMQQLRPCLELLPWNEERRRKTDRLHAELYSALVEADEKTFREKMSNHQNSAYECLLSRVRTPPDPVEFGSGNGARV